VIPTVEFDEPTLLRNSDSWRIGYQVAYLDNREVLVSHDGRSVDVWPVAHVQPIHSADLDRALMTLRHENPIAYNQFLATMLGLDQPMLAP
jgi:hypothetical protein